MKHKLLEFNGVGNGAQQLENQMNEWVKKSFTTGVVLGLSGGVDSTTVACIAQAAFSLNDNKVFALILPSKANNSQDEIDGVKVAKELGIDYKIIPIQPIADLYIETMPEVLDSEFNIGNLYSEIRAVIISRHGAAMNKLVAGTGNKDEDRNLGYFSKRGDGAVDNNILGNLSKRLVRQLASYYGMEERLCNRVATAGLWENQTDENELGFTYLQVEIVMEYYNEFNVDEIKEKTGYTEKIIKDIIHRHNVNEHKRNVPPVGEISLQYCDFVE